MKDSTRLILRIGLCSIVAVCLAITLGCSSPTPDYTGKWTNEKNQESFEFMKDNTYLYQSMGIEISGKWKLLDDGRVKIDMDNAGIAESFTGKIEGGNLILDIEGQETTLLKVK